MRPRPEKKYKEPRTPKRRRVSDIVYLMTILTAFETIGIAMLVFPRSTESITVSYTHLTLPTTPYV